MFQAFRACGFGLEICRWICNFHNNVQSAVSQWPDVYHSGFLFREGVVRGTHCHLTLFTMRLETLAIVIRQHRNFQGIVIGETEHNLYDDIFPNNSRTQARTHALTHSHTYTHTHTHTQTHTQTHTHTTYCARKEFPPRGK